MTKKPVRAIFIDATNRKITSFQWDNDTASLRKLLGGYLEAVSAPGIGQDTLYVNDEGLLGPTMSFFTVKGYDQPLGGSGVLVGREQEDNDRNFLGCADVTLSLDALGQLVKFMSRVDFDQWIHMNRHKPAVAIHTFNPGEPVEREVLSTYGEIGARMGKPS